MRVTDKGWWAGWWNDQRRLPVLLITDPERLSWRVAARAIQAWWWGGGRAGWRCTSRAKGRCTAGDVVITSGWVGLSGWFDDWHGDGG
jgi:hypothetical protein